MSIFTSIDWDELRAKKVRRPLQISVNSANDTHYFDALANAQKPVEETSAEARKHSMHNVHFSNFTYERRAFLSTERGDYSQKNGQSNQMRRESVMIKCL
jgi:hypothetical protein